MVEEIDVLSRAEVRVKKIPIAKTDHVIALEYHPLRLLVRIVSQERFA